MEGRTGSAIHSVITQDPTEPGVIPGQALAVPWAGSLMTEGRWPGLAALATVAVHSPSQAEAGVDSSALSTLGTGIWSLWE